MSIISNNGKFFRVVACATVSTILTTIMAVAVTINARPRSVPDLSLVASQLSHQVSDNLNG
jgi:hypothetical protein